MNTKHLFLSILEAEKSKIKATAYLCLVRAHFLINGPLLTITSHGKRGKLVLWGLP